MYQRILVAIEHSPADETILAHVQPLARLTQARLLLLHVADGWAARAYDELQLRESFVLQKIAEVEKIELQDADIDAEVERLADQYDESPRRIRAQLERDNLMESLALQLVERRSLELILEHAQFEDIPLEPEKAVTAVEQQAVAGELREMTEEPAKEAE